MFKKTKVRSILELLGKNLSARKVSKVLNYDTSSVKRKPCKHKQDFLLIFHLFAKLKIYSKVKTIIRTS